MQPELIADYACEVGEGPLYHPQEKRVYWTDIPAGRLFRYDPASGKHEICYEGDPVGGFTIQADGALLLFGNRGSVRIWKNGAITPVIEEIAQEREARFNDVIADPAGRVFCGTLAEDAPGRLYRLNRDGSLHLMLEGIRCSNGMGFTPDRKQMYYTDSLVREIYVFDYDQATGNITNQRLVSRNAEADGLPDGMTVDAEGCLWSACWDGGCLRRLSPDGTELLRIAFPARKVSSVIFGGDDYTDIYVTTAGGNKKETDGAGAGALYRLNLGIRGVPEFFSRIRL